MHVKAAWRGPCAHLLAGVYVRLAVQAAYPPPLLGPVVCRLQRRLALEGGAVAGLQAGLLGWGQVLGPGSDHLGRLHIFVSLVLGSVWGRGSIIVSTII